MGLPPPMSKWRFSFLVSDQVGPLHLSTVQPHYNKCVIGVHSYPKTLSYTTQKCRCPIKKSDPYTVLLPHRNWRSTSTECRFSINWFPSQLLSWQLLYSQLLPSYKNLSLVEFNTTCVFVASSDVGYTPQSEWEMGRWTLPISEPWRRWARNLVQQVSYTSFLF